MGDTDTLPKAYIIIGSNIEPEKNLQAAVDALRKRCNVIEISKVYQSPAFGFEDQPDFLDVVVKISTPIFPAAFKEALEKIEKQLGRDRANQATKHGPLTLDMDILLWGESVLTYGKKPWRVPHENILKYAAVAIPLAEIAPKYLHPDEEVTIKEIAARFDASTVTLRPDVKIV